MADLRALFSSKEHAWGTPPELVHAVEQHLGLTVSLDAAALPWSSRAARFIAPPEFVQGWPVPGVPVCAATDALSGELWPAAPGSLVWLNPPYTNLKAWILEAQRQALLLRCAVAFVPPVRSDTGWWHSAAFDAAQWLMIRGRIKFRLPPWIATCGAPACTEDVIKGEPCPACGCPWHQPKKTSCAPFPACVLVFDGRKPSTGSPIVSPLVLRW